MVPGLWLPWTGVTFDSNIIQELEDKTGNESLDDKRSKM
jgi:hypothetical protein